MRLPKICDSSSKSVLLQRNASDAVKVHGRSSPYHRIESQPQLFVTIVVKRRFSSRAHLDLHCIESRYRRTCYVKSGEGTKDDASSGGVRRSFMSNTCSPLQ